MCKHGVYQIVLTADNRSYIGSAIDIAARWQQHRNKAASSGNRQVIAKALAKYGVENFEWKILEECNIEDLIVREQYWLDKIRPFADEHNGFNIRKVADSNFGIKRSKESKQKQSDTMTGVCKTEEHKKNMSKNWHRTAEYYQQLSDRIKGTNNPACRPEVREKISKAMTGKTWKEDISRVQHHINQRLGTKRTEVARENMKLAQQLNSTRSPAAKEKFYLAQRILYEITTPIGTTFQMYSRELKIFCKANNLAYANLITTAKTKKMYKSWIACRV